MRFLVLSLAILLLPGCSGEDRETRLYGPNAHRIAGDTAPWANERFDGSEPAWTRQMESRARLQNEYARIR